MALGGSRGQAIVLDSPRDPLAIYQQKQQTDAANAYRQQQLDFQKQKQKDAEVNKTLQHKYLDTPDMFKAWGEGVINKTKAGVFDYLQNNPDADSLNQKQVISQINSKADKEIAYATELADLWKKKEDAIKTPGIDQIKYKENLNKLRNADPQKIDRDMLENFDSLPVNFDVDGMVAESVKGIKDQVKVDSLGKVTEDKFGRMMTIDKGRKRFKDIDATMDFILGGDDISEIGQQQYIRGNQIVDGVLAQMAQEQADPNDLRAVMSKYNELNSTFDTPPKTDEEVMKRNKLTKEIKNRVRPILEQLNQEERGVEIKVTGRKSGSERIKEQEDLTRKKDLEALASPYGTDNALAAPTTRAQEAAQKLRGGDFMGGKVTDVKFKKGGKVISPEYSAKLGDAMLKSAISGDHTETVKLFKEAKNHMVDAPKNTLLITTKTGTAFGEPTTMTDLPIDLTDPGSKIIMNALMNQNPGEGKVTSARLEAQESEPVDLGIDFDDDLEGE